MTDDRLLYRNKIRNVITVHVPNERVVAKAPARSAGTLLAETGGLYLLPLLVGFGMIIAGLLMVHSKQK